MSNVEYISLIAGMGIVTYLPRWLPIAILTKRTLPNWLTVWLDFIPVTILSALTFPLLFVNEKSGTIELTRPEFLAAVPTFIFAIKYKSLGGTVVVGMLSFWGIKLLL